MFYQLYVTTTLGLSIQDVNVAILDYYGAGVFHNELVLFSNKFRASMLKHSKFRILERALMNAVLSIQGIPKFAACNLNSCFH
jgi:hypothetical protein